MKSVKWIPDDSGIVCTDSNLLPLVDDDVTPLPRVAALKVSVQAVFESQDFVIGVVE